MTEQELIAKCPALLGNPRGARGGRLTQARELRWLRENLLADADAGLLLLLARAEWNFTGHRVPWRTFMANYKASGPRPYGYPGLGVG